MHALHSRHAQPGYLLGSVIALGRPDPDADLDHFMRFTSYSTSLSMALSSCTTLQICLVTTPGICKSAGRGQQTSSGMLQICLVTTPGIYRGAGGKDTCLRRPGERPVGEAPRDLQSAGDKARLEECDGKGQANRCWGKALPCCGRRLWRRAFGGESQASKHTLQRESTLHYSEHL